MKYLVLGSAGLIGKEFCSLAKSKGDEVIEYDLVDGPEFDLRVPHSNLYEFMNESDFCMFFAFDVGGSKYLGNRQNTYNFIDNNMRIMVNTFDAISDTNLPFFFASSQMSNMKTSNYGLLKCIGESYTITLGSVITKLWNVYGIETNTEKSHVITDFIKQALTEGEINMATTGEESRQFLHVADCANAFWQLSKIYDELPRNKEYHITSFKWTKIKDLALKIALYTGIETVSIPTYSDEIQQNIMNEPDRFIQNYWHPSINFDMGLMDLVKYYKEQHEVV